MWKGNFKPFMFQPNLYLKRYICKFWIKCSDLCAGVNGSGTCMVRARPQLILKSIAAKSQTYGAIPWKTERGKKQKVQPQVKRHTPFGGRGCIDFTLQEPRPSPHYQRNSLIWTSKTSSAIGFLPFSILLSRIYEHQLSVQRMAT